MSTIEGLVPLMGTLAAAALIFAYLFRQSKDKSGDVTLSAADLALVEKQIEAMRPPATSSKVSKVSKKTKKTQDEAKDTLPRGLTSRASVDTLTDDFELVDAPTPSTNAESEAQVQVQVQPKKKNKAKKKQKRTSHNFNSLIVEEADSSVAATDETEDTQETDEPNLSPPQSPLPSLQLPVIDTAAITAPLQATIDAQSSQLSSLSSTLSVTAASLESSKADVKAVQAQFQDLQTKYAKLQQESLTLTETNRALAKYAQDATAKQDELKKELTLATASASASVVASATAVVATSAVSAPPVPDLSHEVVQLTDRLAAKESEVSSLTLLVTSLNESLKSTQDAFVVEKKSIEQAHEEALESSKLSLTAHFDQLSVNHTAELARLENELANANETIGRLEKEKSGLAAVHANEVDHITKEWTKKVESLERSISAQVESAVARAVQSVSAANEQVRAALAQELDELHSNEVKGLKSAHADTLASLVKELESVRAASTVSSTGSDEIDALNKEWINKVNALEKSVAGQVDVAVQSALQAFARESEQVRVALVKEIDKLHLNEVKGLKAAHADALTTLANQLQAPRSLPVDAPQANNKTTQDLRAARIQLQEMKSAHTLAMAASEKELSLARATADDFRTAFSVSTAAHVEHLQAQIVSLQEHLSKKDAALSAAASKLDAIEASVAALKTAPKSTTSPVVHAAPITSVDIAPTPTTVLEQSSLAVIDIPSTSTSTSTSTSPEILALYETLLGQRTTITSLATSLEDALLSKSEQIAKTIAHRVSHPDLVAGVVKKDVRAGSPVGSLIHKFEDAIAAEGSVHTVPVPKPFVGSPKAVKSASLAKAPVASAKSVEIVAPLPVVPEVVVAVEKIAEPVVEIEPVTQVEPETKVVVDESVRIAYEVEIGAKAYAVSYGALMESTHYQKSSPVIATFVVPVKPVQSVSATVAPTTVKEIVTQEVSVAKTEYAAHIHYEVEAALKSVAVSHGLYLESINQQQPVAPVTTVNKAVSSPSGTTATVKEEPKQPAVVLTKPTATTTTVTTSWTPEVVAAELATGLNAATVSFATTLETFFASTPQDDTTAEEIEYVPSPRRKKKVSWPVFVHGTGVTVEVEGLDPVAQEAEFMKAVEGEIEKMVKQGSEKTATSEVSADVVAYELEVARKAGVVEHAEEVRAAQSVVEPVFVVVDVPSAVTVAVVQEQVQVVQTEPCVARKFTYNLSETCRAYEVEAGAKFMARAMYGRLPTPASTSSQELQPQQALQQAKSQPITQAIVSDAVSHLVSQLDTLHTAAAAEYEVQGSWSQSVMHISNQIEALHCL